jgi:hypothetical protein
MLRRRNSRAAALAGALLLMTGCGKSAPASPNEPRAERPTLGLMTSLPLYWPEGADMADLAGGRAPVPWQRGAIEQAFTLVPLDTLSSIPGLSPDSPEVDPLAGLSRLAVIQPRGLAPADNVALDSWVRAGGRLLLVLDPALTGEYQAPLGDPRRPVEAAVIPPVVARWGLTVRFDEAQDAAPRTAPLGEDFAPPLPLGLAGEIALSGPATSACTVTAQGAAALCRVGKGQVTLIADAALFEHRELAGEGGAQLLAVMAAAFN